MRIARTVTGRGTIAIFNGSYHGIFDEVIVRGTKKQKAVPAAPGIMPSSSQNVLVLDYGTPESLAILKSRADELAAILVEPVQSRRPDFQPREFLGELETSPNVGVRPIFDEVGPASAHPGARPSSGQGRPRDRRSSAEASHRRHRGQETTWTPSTGLLAYATTRATVW
jgi:glutamate-1-semialdehyde aminotransferase